MEKLLEYLVGTESSIIIIGAIACLKFGTKIWKYYKDQSELSRDIDRETLRYNLASACRSNLERGSISRYTLESVDHQFKLYKKLGGNGIIEDGVMRLHKLPIEDFKGAEKNDQGRL
jgi:hypothetical protein